MDQLHATHHDGSTAMMMYSVLLPIHLFNSTNLLPRPSSCPVFFVSFVAGYLTIERGAVRE